MQKFIIEKNEFLKYGNIKGYYHQYYTGFKKEGNPDFVNVLKNTFNSESFKKLNDAKEKVIDILKLDIPNIIKENGLSNCMCICVPRAKALNTYSSNQLLFKDAIRIASYSLVNVTDGTSCIIRTKNTKTTHLKNVTFENDGDMPYVGITKNTCHIDTNTIRDKNIILIDDIYTKSVNVDEDCIQALFDNGAKNVIFYSIGYTRRL